MNDAEITGVIICAFIGICGYIIGRSINAFDEKEFEDFHEAHWLVMKQMEEIYKARQEDAEGRLLENVKAGAAHLGLTNADADFIIAYAKQREATK
jgi:hypothetical protein